MKINNRLRSVASLVSCNTSIIDVGCDHALLSIYLYLNKENVKVIASDIKINDMVIFIIKPNLLPNRWFIFSFNFRLGL